jgi:hypothetical protein
MKLTALMLGSFGNLSVLVIGKRRMHFIGVRDAFKKYFMSDAGAVP